MTQHVWGKLGALALRYAFVFVFLAMIVVFAVQSPAFVGLGNVGNILRTSALLALVAVALTLVFAAGGIDLSIGIALDFGAWFTVIAVLEFGLPWPIAIIVGLAGGAVVGCVNALLIVGLGVTPFLATLGTFFMGRSVQQIATNGGANVSFRQAPAELHSIATGTIFGLSHQVIIAAIIAVLCAVLLRRTRFGVGLNAMGMQLSAASVAGIPTKRYRVAVYVLAGVIAASAGVLLASGLRIYTPLSGFSYLLDGIAAVFIGAAMHRDSRPNVGGTLIGVLFLSTLRVGLDLLGLDFNLKAALNGIVLLLALAFAFLVSRRARIVS